MGKWRSEEVAINIMRIMQAYVRYEGNLGRVCKATGNAPITVLKYKKLPYEELSLQTSFSDNQLQILEDLVRRIEKIKPKIRERKTRCRKTNQDINESGSVAPEPQPEKESLTDRIRETRPYKHRVISLKKETTQEPREQPKATQTIHTLEIISLFNYYLRLGHWSYKMDKEKLSRLMDEVPILKKIIHNNKTGSQYHASLTELETNLVLMASTLRSFYLNQVLQIKSSKKIRYGGEEEKPADKLPPDNETEWYKATNKKLEQGQQGLSSIEKLLKQGKRREAKELFLEEKARWDGIYERWEVLGLGTDLEEKFESAQKEYLKLEEKFNKKPASELQPKSLNNE